MNPDEKANVINQYFTEQSTVDDSNATLPPHEPPNSTLQNILLSEQDVTDVLDLLDTNKANGPDLIDPKLLKEGACVFDPYLTNTNAYLISLFQLHTFLWNGNLQSSFQYIRKGTRQMYQTVDLFLCLAVFVKSSKDVYLNIYITT